MRNGTSARHHHHDDDDDDGGGDPPTESREPEVDDPTPGCHLGESLGRAAQKKRAVNVMKRNVLAAQENAGLCCVTSKAPITNTGKNSSRHHHGNKILTRCENEV